ncbi:MAG: alkaline shock response membrane anchor protein AmaP [Bacilli bacterium]|nr:alkaline shock response membrane anchor protein AmaP [Bacilli bacterium]
MEYVAVYNPQKLGKIRVSKKTIESIVSHAVGEIQVASVAKKGGNPFYLFSPVHAHIHKSGKVDIYLEVELLKGCRVKDAATKVQSKIAEEISQAFDGMQFAIAVKVKKLV